MAVKTCYFYNDRQTLLQRIFIQGRGPWTPRYLIKVYISLPQYIELSMDHHHHVCLSRNIPELMFQWYPWRNAGGHTMMVRNLKVRSLLFPTLIWITLWVLQMVLSFRYSSKPPFVCFMVFKGSWLWSHFY